MVRIGVVAEGAAETRVAGTPPTVAQLIKLGYEVVVESGAGAKSSFTDEAYTEAGASIGNRDDAWAGDIVLKVNAPSDEEIDRLRDSAIVIGMLQPGLNPDLVEKLASRPITALAMDAVPRISRAQSLDVLSSMANIAGYRAVYEAAYEFDRFLGGQITAAGKVNPAKILVAGAGVAGLAAIGQASALGAIVRATDPRPEVADQVKSLGGEYLAVDVEVEQTGTGYAGATSEDYDRRAAEIYSEQAADVDIIITTALIPGKPAPTLITAADVASMKAGSVIVDLAASNGGNVEGTVKGEKTVTENGVTILGYTDLPGRLPAQASQLYGQNLVNLMKLLTPGKDGEPVLDLDDVVVRGVTVVKDGKNLWPPPPVQVSAAPTPTKKEPAEPPKQKAQLTPRAKGLIAGVGILALLFLTSLAPPDLARHLMVLVLSIVIGYYVIGNVHHALHTPLMSVTNAISGVILVGALLQVGHDNWLIRILATAAILLASINVFGGFAVTRRMLGMFSKEPAKGGH